jgi:hypothetical protein
VPQLTRNPSIEGFSEAGKGRRTRSSNVRGVRPLVCPRVVVQTEWYRVENWSYQGCSENPWNGGVATWRAKLCAHLCTRTEFRLLPQAVEVYCPTLIAVERSPTSGLTQNYRSLDTQDLSDKPCLYLNSTAGFSARMSIASFLSRFKQRSPSVPSETPSRRRRSRNLTTYPQTLSSSGR